MILEDGLAMVQIEGVGDVGVSSRRVVELEEPAELPCEIVDWL